MKTITFNLGDIVRWSRQEIGKTKKYNYGMVIGEPEEISTGTYTFYDEFMDQMDIDDESAPDIWDKNSPLISIDVYSFNDQAVITLYKDAEDVLEYLEKVTFSQEND
jgi:hypothetical protein